MRVVGIGSGPTMPDDSGPDEAYKGFSGSLVEATTVLDVAEGVEVVAAGLACILDQIYGYRK